MRTDDTINNILHEYKPVKQVPHPGISLLSWLVTASFCIGTSLALFGIRPDSHSLFTNMSTFVQFGLATLMSVLSAASAIYMSIPAAEKRVLNWLPFLTGAAWVLILLTEIFSQERHPEKIGFGCILDIIVLGFLPGVALFVIIRRRFALDPGRTGLFILLSVAAAGAAGTQFLCKNDSPQHILVWHFLPVLALGAFGIFIGKKFLIHKPFTYTGGKR